MTSKPIGDRAAIPLSPKCPAGAQKLKSSGFANLKKHASPPRKLARVTFKTSREMDFFSEKELVTQTGHEKEDWLLVVAKELIDSSLDECENANIAPTITVALTEAGIALRDNGPGLAEETLRGAMDFTVRAQRRGPMVRPPKRRTKRTNSVIEFF